MTTKIAINGFGRIGRLVLRALVESNRDDLEIVAINDLSPIETNAHLFKFDSVHGRFDGDVVVDGDKIIINNKHSFKVTTERNPENLPWGELGVDIAIESTGIFTSRDQASLHLKAGAKKVLISAPANDSDLTVVYGVNHDKIDGSQAIISNASCTTNCLAPLAKAIHDDIGIDNGFMTTIHAYTNDQNTQDQFHKDPYRARAAALNMIPTSTGAAKAVGLVLPELNGKLDGVAIRVPTPNVSVVDLKFNASKDTTIDEVNAAIKKAAASANLKGILEFTEVPNVSTDFNHSKASSTVALDQTKVINKRLVRVLSWYDNEWGFSNRMLDTASQMAKYL